MVCFMRQALATARLCSNDLGMHRRVVMATAALLPSLDPDLSPPVNAMAVYRRIAEMTGVSDPFAQLKKNSTSQALSLRESVRVKIDNAEDPLYAAMRFAIAGNIIDYGTRHAFDVNHTLSRCLEHELAVDDFIPFSREIHGRESLNVLYLADNCGEIVFDALLIEQLQHHDHRVTMVVRGGSILNDATVEAAAETGVDAICRVIASGCACPGTPLALCTDELQRAFFQADIIISKGQGNFETLSETAGPIYFLLSVKCPVVARHITGLQSLEPGGLSGSGDLVLMKTEEHNACTTDS